MDQITGRGGLTIITLRENTRMIFYHAVLCAFAVVAIAAAFTVIKG